MRDYQSTLSPVEIQKILPSTSRGCRSFAAAYRIPITQISLPENTLAFKLGRDGPAWKVIVFFHGGGYATPALRDHFRFAYGFDPEAASQNGVSLFVLEYGLASERKNQYPRQLQQAVWLMAHILHDRGIPASDITLIGDSAGAHLLLSLLVHIARPNTRVSPLEIPGGGRLSAAILVSPWVNMHSSAKSMVSNQRRDVLDASSLAYWATNFLGDIGAEYWNDPMAVPADMWGSVPVDRMFVVYGEDELFRDDIQTFCTTLQDNLGKEDNRFCSVSVPGEIHEHMIMNRFLRIGKSCESEKVFMSWLKELGIVEALY
ncbi:Alpha/Beta hydrolase protein [Aspergillus californicus]